MALLDEVLATLNVIRRAPVASDVFSVGLPFRAVTAKGAPTIAKLTHALSHGLWENAIDRQDPTDRIELRTPVTGVLRLTTEDGAEQVVIDTAFDPASILRGLGQAGIPAGAAIVPFVSRWKFRGLSLNGFAPKKAVDLRLEAMRKTQPEATPVQAAADLLARLKMDENQSLDVFTGEVIGTLDTGPVTLVCELPDGSALPLMFVYGALLAASKTFVTEDAQKSPLLMPVLKGPFGLFADFVIPPDGDRHGHLPRSAAVGSFVLRFEPGGTQAELGVLPGQRRLVAERPSGATHATVSLFVGAQPVEVQVPWNGEPPPGAATSWHLKLTATTQRTYVGGPPSRIAIDKPVAPLPLTTSIGTLEYVYARLVPVQGEVLPLTIEGSGPLPPKPKGSEPQEKIPIQFAIDGNVVERTELKEGRWQFTLPMDRVVERRTLTISVETETTTVRIVDLRLSSLGKTPVAWLPAPSEPTVEIQRNDAMGDTRDTFALKVKAASALLTADFGTGPFYWNWSLTVRTAIPQRNKKFDLRSKESKEQGWQDAWIIKCPKEEKRPGTFGIWVPCKFRSGGRQLLADTWTPEPELDPDPKKRSFTWMPGPLELDPKSIAAENLDPLGLSVKTSWAGNRSKGAGPICGIAVLGGEIYRGSTPLATVLPLEIRAVGYEFGEVSFKTFWNYLLQQIDEQFMQKGYPYQDVLALKKNDLAMLMLAIFFYESHYDQFAYGNNRYSWNREHDTPDGKEIKNPDFLPMALKIWGAGPITMPPPPPEMRAQGMPLIGLPADSGVGQISPPNFAQFFDWRANIKEAVHRLRQPFDVKKDMRAWAIKQERARLVGLSPQEKDAAEIDLNEKDTNNRLTQFLEGTGVAKADDEKGVLTDPDKLLAMFTQMYNNSQDIPFQSNLVWDQAGPGQPKIFKPSAELAQRPHPSSKDAKLADGVKSYGFNRVELYKKVRKNFDPDTMTDRKNNLIVTTIHILKASFATW